MSIINKQPHESPLPQKREQQSVRCPTVNWDAYGHIYGS